MWCRAGVWCGAEVGFGVVNVWRFDVVQMLFECGADVVIWSGADVGMTAYKAIRVDWLDSSDDDIQGCREEQLIRCL